MKIRLKSMDTIIQLSAFIGIITFTLSYATASYWQKDGFSLVEVSLLTILTGFYFFITIIVGNAVGLNKYIRSIINEGCKAVKRRYLVLLVLLFSFMFYLLFDTIIFFVDKSISIDYANALMELATANNDSLQGIDDFAKIPFAIQNGIATFIFALIGALASILFLKKDGQLLQTNRVM